MSTKYQIGETVRVVDNIKELARHANKSPGIVPVMAEMGGQICTVTHVVALQGDDALYKLDSKYNWREEWIMPVTEIVIENQNLMDFIK